MPNQRPNVIFFITDDQSWDTVGFMGGKVHTPRLDQMAADGMFLSNFNVTSTVCSPSRYSYLTGRYAGRCAGPAFTALHPPGAQTQVENINELEADQWNLPKLLQANGYRTGFVGKSHVTRHDWITDQTQVAWTKDANPRDPFVNRAMHASHQRWCDEMKLHGFDEVSGFYPANLFTLRNDQLNIHNFDWTIERTLNFLDDRSDDQPFFLHVATTLHHGPAPAATKNSLNADPHLCGEGFIEQGFDAMASREEILAQNRAAGYEDDTAFAYWLDQGVGAIIDKVKELGLAEDTLIVFTSDHGSYRHGKATLHDYGMRVPTLALWPGTITGGKKYDHMLANIDWAPTVLDLAGIEAPADYHIDGQSFKPVLDGSSDPIREVLFGEMGHSRGIKTDRWKYIAVRYPSAVEQQIQRGEKFDPFLKDDPKLDQPYLTRNTHLGHYASQVNPNYFVRDQLYDLQADPEETVNVFDQHPEVVVELKSKLTTSLATFPGRPFGEFITES